MATTELQGSVLHALEADERSQVLDGLLAARPELRSQAEVLARRALDAVDPTVVASDVVDVFGRMEVQQIGDRMGRRRGGWYVDEHEAAWQLLEEALEPFLAQIRRRGSLGFTDAAGRYAAGVLAGLEQLREQADPDTVLGWDGSDETVGSLVYSVEHAVDQVGARLPDAHPEGER